MGARGSKVFNGGLISYDFLGMDYENGSYLAYSTLTSFWLKQIQTKKLKIREMDPKKVIKLINKD